MNNTTPTFTTSTKRIARLTGLSVAAVNEAARDLKIASYRADLRSWRIPSSLEAQFIQHLREVIEDVAA